MALVFTWRKTTPQVSFTWRTPDGQTLFEESGQDTSTLAAVIGLPGITGDVSVGIYGWIKISDTTHSDVAPQNLTAGQRTLLTNNAGSVGPQSLKAPFDTHNFISGNLLRSYASGDSYMVRISLYTRPTVMNTRCRVELDIGGSIGVIQSDQIYVNQNAGEIELSTTNFDLYALDTFLANGGGFYLTSDSNLDIWGFSLLVIPIYTP